MKTLIAYFSAEGTTGKLAKQAAEQLGADTFEIIPEPPYTQADINWKNPLSRCNREFFSKKYVPIKETTDISEYDVIAIGFPIWYGCAPLVVNSFCRDLDFTGKKVIVFATSGGSGIGETVAKLQPSVNGTTISLGAVIKSADELTGMVKNA